MTTTRSVPPAPVPPAPASSASPAALLSVVKTQLDTLEARRNRRFARFAKGLAEQQFFYVADTNGYVRLQQDAVYILDQVTLIGVNTARFAMEDAAASRRFTVSFAPVTLAVAAPDLVNTVFIPTESFSPLFDFPLMTPSVKTLNTDYVYPLPSEVVIPRAGVLWFQIEVDPVSSLPNKVQVVLSGRKKF